jgi:hypothetical protein
MNKTLYYLASCAGATDVEGGPVTENGPVCFASNEFEDFIQRMVNFQITEMSKYEHERRNDFMGDDVPPVVLYNHLQNVMGVK